MKKTTTLLLIFTVCLICAIGTDAEAFEVQKSAVYVYLHEVKPIEEKAAEALEEGDYAEALRKYKEALREYERIWKEYPNLVNERPKGIDQMVDESIEECKKTIEDIKDKGEAQDEFYQQLNQTIRVDFLDEDIRQVAKSLTFLTDVNIIVDDTVLRGTGDALQQKVTIRTNQPWPLRTIITHVCRQAGLAYTVEVDHVFISTRVKLDERR